VNELMQNTVDHAFPLCHNDRREGHVVVRITRDDSLLVVDVIDDGVGLPRGFTLDRNAGLGLSIVHTLVTSELGGSIEMVDRGGTHVHLCIPLRSPEPF
jgi:two-component sensor histidine kinase